ncbi:MAG: HEAT repeat domain-containing protein [Planctomycetota bacterium]
MKTAVWMLAVLLGVCPLLGAAENGKSPMVMFQEALYQEETEGDLDKAIELYQQVLEEAAEVERIAARTTYQLGLCHLKKGELETAADYFQQVISKYPKQISTVKKTRAQLEKIAPEDRIHKLVETFFKNNYRDITSRKTLEWGEPITDENGNVSIRYKYEATIWDKDKVVNNEIFTYDKNGKFVSVEDVIDTTTQEGIQKLVQNFFKNNYRDITSRKTLEWDEAITDENGTISIRYKYEATIRGKDKIVNNEIFSFDSNGDFVSVKKIISPEELKAIVEKAVLTISTCAETDPRVEEALESLKGIQEEPLVSELATYLSSETATIRRSAIYILWRGGFSGISAAEQNLLELCSHPESLTRSMAALPLGEYKIAAAYDRLVDMTLHDKDGIARRGGAYALGLLGDPKALRVLEEALQDPEDFVKQNAQAAITLLTKLNDEQSEDAEPEPDMTQEMYNDIQPDGTIKFRSPDQVINNGTEPTTEQRFINSDFVELTAMTDEQGNPIDFTTTHDGNIYRYHVIFDPPVMPGETLNYHTEGTIAGLVKPANEKDTYRYHMTHTPATGQPTLRIEEYVLPEGAELLTTLSEDMVQSDRNGRVVLRIEKVISAGGSLTTSFKYRLESPIDLSTPEATISGFMQAAFQFDVDKVMSYVASDSHEYADTKEIFENPDHPFYALFKKADASIPLKITKTDISDTMCSAVWEFTLKEDFSIEGKALKAGDTFELDGNLHKYDDKWLITGI